MSKKLFKDLKTCGFIFVDEEKTKKANERYDKAFLTYYRFDIDRMIKMVMRWLVENNQNN